MKISGISPNRFNYNARNKNQNTQAKNVQNNPQKNINFGRFLDENAKQVTRTTLDNYRKKSPCGVRVDDEFRMLDRTDLAEIYTDSNTGKVIFKLLAKESDFTSKNARSLIEDIVLSISSFFPKIRDDINAMDSTYIRPFLSIFAEKLIDAQEEEGEQQFYDSLPPEEQAEIDRAKAEDAERERQATIAYNAQVAAEERALAEARANNWWF